MTVQLKKRVPVLRFPEFEEEWMIMPLNKFLTQSKAKNKKLEFEKSQVLSVAAEAGVVNQIEYHGRSYAGVSVAPYGIVRKGEMVYTKSPLKAYPYGIIKINERQDGIVSTLYAIYSVNDKSLGKFLDYYFYYPPRINRYLKPLVNIGAKNDMKVNNDHVISDSIIAPVFQEQQKIADFLTTIDTRIQQLTRKVDLLEQYKKGVMQQIFSQEIRFKDEERRDFPAWEEKRLGEIGDPYNGLSGKSKKDFGKGKPFVTYKQIFDNSRIDTLKFDFVEISPGERQSLVKYGDIFFTTSSETPNEVGFASVLLDRIEELYLNSFCFGYRAKSFKILKPEFARFFFRSPIFRKKIFKLAQGSTRYNMSKTELMKLTIFLPTEAEQQKIADFLTSIDQKIAYAKNQLELMQTFKKGLLQQMFV